MKTICFFIGNLNFSGGTERVSTIIANELAKKGYKILFLSLYEGTKPYFFLNEKISTAGLFLEKISFSNKYFSIIHRLRQFIREQNIDTVISVDSMLCLFSTPAIRFLNVKHICWEHFNFTADLGEKTRRYARLLAAIFCDYIITLTETDKSIWLKKTLHRAKVLSIHNPSSFAKTSHIPSFDKKIILSVGRYRYQKGFDLLIEAWAKAISQIEGWKLKIVGDGEQKEKLLSLIKKYDLSDSVELIPSTKDIHQYFQNASFYCMSSRFEGLPMVLLEAQSYNLPIVSFDCLTGPGELIDNGVDGLLTKPEDTTGLSEAIVKLSKDQDLFNRMVNHLFHKDTRSFKLEYIIAQWETILQ